VFLLAFAMRRKTTLRALIVVLLVPIAFALAVAMAFYVRYQLNDHAIELPAPRGPHQVGRMLVDWTDAGRNRELMVFIWYPAIDQSAGRHCQYIPGKWGELESENMVPIPAKRLQEIQVGAIEKAPLADGIWPVLMLLPGMGRIPAHYTTIAEDFASFGYIVAGVTPTGSSQVVFADGRIESGREFNPDTDGPAVAQEYVQTWAGDASFALDQLESDAKFAGHVQRDRVGIFGHSFGGTVALHVLQRDSRFSRAANVDGWMFGDPVENLDKPILVLVGQTGIQPSQQAVRDTDRAGGKVELFSDARHMNFSDAGVLPSRFPLPKSLLQLGDVDGVKFLQNISDRLREFFDEMP
jgi:dienelactone hydrolase